jgi:radical SAM protein with 4Fe4S-binding SPASM domain
MATLELAARRIRRGGQLDVTFRHWDCLANWPIGRECIRDLTTYVHQTRELRGSITIFSRVHEVNPAIWEFLYDNSFVRLGWVWTGLSDYEKGADIDDGHTENPSFKLLQTFSDLGFTPQVVVPVSRTHVKEVPSVVQALVDATHGGSIQILPVSNVRRGESPTWDSAGLVQRAPEARAQFDVPTSSEYTEALLEIYRNPRVPLHSVSPLNWVAERIECETSLISSWAAVGAELAVVPNGDIYAGENSVGLKQWYLGNVLEGLGNVCWERLDAIAENSSYSLMPKGCKACAWRYRCGGMDQAVAQMDEQRLASGRPGPSLADLYCHPRKALFEDLLWDSLRSDYRKHQIRTRERVQIANDTIAFHAVSNNLHREIK